MFQHVFRIFGLPLDVVLDRGPQFKSLFWRVFCRLLGAKVSLSSCFHSKSNGQMERINQDLETILRCFASTNPSTWSRYVGWAEYSHNILCCLSTGMSPFECQFGYQPPLFPSQEAEVGVPSAQAFVKRCRRVWRRIWVALQKSTRQYPVQADHHRRPAPFLCPGQRVCLSAFAGGLSQIGSAVRGTFQGALTDQPSGVTTAASLNHADKPHSPHVLLAPNDHQPYGTPHLLSDWWMASRPTRSVVS